jgi:polar amino acid transport system substrate-binding protein
MTARRTAVFTGLTLAALLTAAGCVSTSRAASDVAVNAVDTATATTTTVAPTGSTTTSTTLPNPCQKSDPARSYQPSALPPPGVPPSRTWADEIRTRKLIVGVDENTYFFSFKDPLTGTITGFEADLARAIARVIFPGVEDIDTKIKFVTVTTNEKFGVVQDGTVDMTIDVATIGCTRWGFVDFSTPYYEAHQALMVRDDAQIEGQGDLGGKRVCVTTPSSSETFVSGNIPDAKIVRANTRTECLTRLQENTVDAVVLPSSIQAGLLVQDPDMRLVGTLHGSPEAPAENLYGIAVNKANRDLTRFVNALLEQWRRDGTLERLQSENKLPTALRQAPPDARYLD